jgi:NAD(P)-dependent dehydrogenase (short-subunit alcohol dehydrogenase family)
MVNTLENQTVVILGGTSGIGYGVAKNIIESTKAKIVIASSNEKKVEQAVTSLSHLDGGKGRVTGHSVNLDTSVSDDSIKQFLDIVGNFNHLIYTAADPLYMIPITDISKPKGDKVFGVRYWSLLATIRLALPHMPKSPESSITITSGNVVFRPMKGWGATLSGVGSAVEGLTRGLAVDLSPIRVNCIAPGAVPETDVWSGMGEEQLAEMVEGLKKKSLTGRVGRVEDIAEGYVYLLKANFTNGQTLLLDGGEYLN